MAYFATLKKWNIRRVGGCMTIEHASGKVTNIKRVFARTATSEMVAVTFNNVEYKLDPAP